MSHAFCRLSIVLVLFAIVATCAWCPSCLAQSSPSADGRSKAKPPTKASGAKPSGKPRPSKPGDDKESKDKEGEGEDKKDGEKKEGDESKEPEVVMRPTEPPEPPDPKEFEQGLGPDGRIQFKFKNQPWTAFLEWLSEIAGYSLDWQQMPSGYLNIVTHRSYTVTEARDLVNRLLLDRGYTMLIQGQVMSIVKLDKLDPSMLYRVQDESELLDLPPHDFVKITFALPEKLKADKASEDVKLFLSPNGKVQPLLSTNRLLVIDAVANLRDISELLNAEHAASESHIVPREFHIKHVRADYVADQVMILLGLDPSTRRSPQELQVEQQRLQLFMQMQQRGKDVTKFLRGDNAPTVFIAVNKRINSLLINAPPAELRQIERAIEQLDVPSGTAGGSMVATASGPGATEGTEMRRYSLVTLKPESVVNALQDIGDLDPRTMLQMDSDAKLIFANATAADHAKISAIIDKLDGSGREVEVIWLKRLPADQVAITIKNLLVEKEDDSKSNSASFYYMRRYGGGDNDNKPKSEFRCEADIEHNRLLLFANESELEAVNKLLVKLGELPGEQGNPNTIRVQDPRGAKDTADLLRKLRELWPAAGGNPIQIQGKLPEADERDSNSSEPTEEPESEERLESTEPEAPKTVAAPRRNRLDQYTHTAVFPQEPRTESPDATAAVQKSQVAGTESNDGDLVANIPGDPGKAPINISIGDDGRIIITSEDTAALDSLEDFIARVAPPPKSHRVFYLRYALASLVKLNLEEYFEGEENFDTQENWMRAWYGMDFKKGKSENNGLATRRPIRFIYDIDTNSILVRDATPSQMAVIEELIEIYDQAPSEESISARRLQVFKLKYSDAEVVAATIKDVFRDLLSSKDKEFANNGNQDKEKRSSSSSFFRIFGGSGGDDDKDKKGTKVKASFEGALSIGVDKLSNAVIVSAQEEWLPSIEQIILYMDENAKPDTTVTVQSVAVPMDPKVIEALSDLMKPWPGNRKPESKNGNQGDAKKNKNENANKPQQGQPAARDDR